MRGGDNTACKNYRYLLLPHAAHMQARGLLSQCGGCHNGGFCCAGCSSSGSNSNRHRTSFLALKERGDRPSLRCCGRSSCRSSRRRSRRRSYRSSCRSSYRSCYRSSYRSSCLSSCRSSCRRSGVSCGRILFSPTSIVGGLHAGWFPAHTGVLCGITGHALYHPEVSSR